MWRSVVVQSLDASDYQWAVFRGNLPLLSVAMLALVAMAGALRATPWGARSPGVLNAYWIIASLAFVTYLHGACVAFILASTVANFLLAKAFAGRRGFPLLLWAANCSFLVLVRVYEGFSFASISSALAFLDHHRGSMRWHISYNMVALRFLSYGLDRHWAITERPPPSSLQEHEASCETCITGRRCYHVRQETSLPLRAYSLGNLVGFCLYAPLFIAGPHVSFNAYVSQRQAGQQSYSVRNLMLYAARYVVCLLLMEMAGHYVYLNALTLTKFWNYVPLDATHVGMLSLALVLFLWLKFLLIWRFFRFWALLDGIESPENMLRCVLNNYDIEGFWKSWHASFNRWLVRYLYIPLGGKRARFLNIWLVFTFVALWHDLEWHLLSWAWITCLCAAPEFIAKFIMADDKFASFRAHWSYRYLCAAGGTMNITGLLLANLVGYKVGTEGGMGLLHIFLTGSSPGSGMHAGEGGPPAHLQPVLCLAVLFAMTQVMFGIREEEQRTRRLRLAAVGKAK
eukprot:jgi/Mesvir1/24007/Mv10753-RA.1